MPLPVLLAPLAAKLAAKMSSLGFKIGAAVVTVLLLVGGGCVWGKSICEKSHRAEITAQAIKSANTMAKVQEAIGKVLVTHIREKMVLEKNAATLQRKVADYANQPHPPCVLSTDFELLWDSANGLPPPPSAAGGVHGGGDSGIKTPAVLSAHADESAALLKCRADKKAMRAYIKNTYEIMKKGAGR